MLQRLWDFFQFIVALLMNFQDITRYSFFMFWRLVIYNYLLVYLIYLLCCLTPRYWISSVFRRQKTTTVQIKGYCPLLSYLMLVSCDLFGQLKCDIFLMSHGVYKDYGREGDIQWMSHRRNIWAYGSNWETNGGCRGILSNVIATGDIHWKCPPVRKVI